MSTAENLRHIALEQPDAEEVETWGHPTFRVGGHIFVGLDEVAGTANINATRKAQASLEGERPDVFSVSPRVGNSGWVTVVRSRIRPVGVVVDRSQPSGELIYCTLQFERVRGGRAGGSATLPPAALSTTSCARRSILRRQAHVADRALVADDRATRID